MPIGYLITTAVLAAISVLAVAPPMPAESSPSNWVYTLTCVVNELPFLGVAWMVASTALAAAEGDLLTPVGLLGLACGVVAVIALAVVARRGLADRRRVARAVDAGLGSHAAGHVPPGHRWWQILFVPFAFRGRRVRRDANLSYGPAGRRNLLDVYHPVSPSGRPVLIYLHGGGFRSGHKNREGKPLVHRLARHGWVCISANYRLERNAPYPASLVDAKRVIAWARANAHRYGGDPARVYIAGASAGGHLALTASSTPNDPEYQPGFEDADTSISGAVSLYAFYGSASDRFGSSPHDHLDAATPPTFVAHGGHDTLVLVRDARAFTRQLGAISDSPLVYAELPGAQHGFDLFRSARVEAVVDGIEVFLSSIGATHVRS